MFGGLGVLGIETGSGVLSWLEERDGGIEDGWGVWCGWKVERE